VLKKIAAIAVSISLSIPTVVQPAYADVARNIVAEGRYSQALVGQTVYYYRGTFDYPPVVVRSVDFYRQAALVEFETRALLWVSASRLYSKTEAQSAQGAEGVGAVGVALILCMFVCPSSSGSGSSGSAGGSNENDDYGNRGRRAPEPPREEPKPDTSTGCAWGDRAYGTCH
jgi:hypothetical protein